MDNPVHVYLLFFEDALHTCYVGQTSDIPRRYDQHIRESSQGGMTIKSRWLRENLEQGKKLRLEIIEGCESREVAYIRETHWIAAFRQAGFDVRNATAGGVGFVGLRRTEQHVSRIRAALKRTWRDNPNSFPGLRFYLQNRHLYARTPKQIAQWLRVIEASRGRPKTAETRSKMSISQRALRQAETPEQKEIRAEAIRLAIARHGSPMLGKKNSQETIEKRVAGLSKHYHLISPTGEAVHVVNMAEFCRQNDLDKRNLQALVAGRGKSHRGWRIDMTQPQGYKPNKAAPLTDAMVEEAWNV